jgi:REP element-mobilizing transposase RayT
MPRRLRCASGGFVYHVLNRAVGRATLFDKSTDYLAFEKVLQEARDWLPVPLLVYCIMPNHWHLLLWPRRDGDLSGGGKRDAARTFWKGLDEIGRSRLDLFLCPDKRAMPLVAWCIMC